VKNLQSVSVWRVVAKALPELMNDLPCAPQLYEQKQQKKGEHQDDHQCNCGNAGWKKTKPAFEKLKESIDFIGHG
jgi:hypothetical protein